ncbi:DNA polymerase kappa subunit [Sporothrix brasiliensis 5110]|uniref:DNA polymerase kappa n=1 Tax=Sporothrix brasiliensis 5110 TaxID=1398154 RepID=A0A0C2J6U6_9PEZI|nr:DNA polymerase kappa subunit [Sporothrix brasiliensis 5110]KIH94675.1 DNA polymerase kappa subunit [Sporothrix brasiliensis 5110]
MGSTPALDLQATPEDSGEASAANRSKETLCLADDHEDDNDPARLTTQPNDSNHPSAHETLKYSLLGPSLLKAGQESVDQSKLENGRDLSQFIVHVDCDAFYASVELLDRPELADVPFAVGRGVLSTCNYVARKFGCRSGMAGFVAKKLCPQLVLLKPDYTKYNAKAQDIRQILAEYDPRFESASIDEAYLNITQYCSSNNMLPAAAVEKLRQEVAEKTKITVSAGIAANTRLAKICSNMNKPNGQFILPNDRAAILDFMKMLPCRKVNGVGRVFERELAALGINTCGDIFDQRMFLSQLFGNKACHFLVQCYLGLGRTRVQPAEEYERKSVGTESTFASISDIGQLRQKLRWTAEELEKDLKRAACKGRTLVLKIKLHTFEVYTRQVVLPRALQQANDLYGYALPMLSKLEQDIPNMTARLMGLRCTHLIGSKRPDALAFFGIKSPGSTETSSNQNPDNRIEHEEIREPIDDDREWEVWPEAESDGGGILKARSRDCKGGSVAPPLQGPPLESELLISQPPAEPAVPEPRPHGKTITANPTSSSSGWGPLSEKKELWSCPSTSRGGGEFRRPPAKEDQF